MRAPVTTRSAVGAPISPENRAKMRIMDDSMAHSGDMLARFELPSWKSWLSWTGAVLTSILFLAAGLWKITDAPAFAVRLAQLKVPQDLTLPASVLLAEITVKFVVPGSSARGATVSAALGGVFECLTR